MEPIYVGDAHLVYLGSRKYVHGTTMFTRFLQVMDQVDGFRDKETLKVVQFNMHRELREHDGIIEVVLGHREPERGLDTLISKMDVMVSDQAATLYLFENCQKRITDRDPLEREKDLVGLVERTAPFEGTCVLRGVRHVPDLMRAIVEANKQIHVETLAGENPRIRWVFLKEFCAPRTLGPQPDLSIVFRHLSAASYQGSRFTRNHFTMESSSGPLKGEICYKYDLVAGVGAIRA